MRNKEQKLEWNELKDIWVNSSQTRDIHIQMSDFLREVKSKASQFERVSIKSDLATLKQSWTQFDRMVSRFEKDSVKKDLDFISRLLKKFLTLFTKGN